MQRSIPLLVLIAGCAAPAVPPAKIAAPVAPPNAREVAPPAVVDRPAIAAAQAEEPAPVPADCPGRLGRVTVTDERLELAEPIYFETGGAVIKEEALPLLDDIAEVLARCPQVTVEIGVHTDPRGSSDWNLRLSHARAFEVQRALVERGIDESRLPYQGYGESCPIVSEDPDPAARMRLMRRTELVRTDTGARSGCPRPALPPAADEDGDRWE